MRITREQSYERRIQEMIREMRSKIAEHTPMLTHLLGMFTSQKGIFDPNTAEINWKTIWLNEEAKALYDKLMQQCRDIQADYEAKINKVQALRSDKMYNSLPDFLKKQ